MTKLNNGTQVGALLAVVTVCCLVGSCGTNRSSAGSPSDTQRQIDASLHTQLKNAAFRDTYSAHLRFMNLYNQMPTLDRATFSSSVRTYYWRSVKWVIQGVFQTADGKIYVRLAYGAGPGVDQESTAQLVDGRYVGAASINWDLLSRNPHFRAGIVPWNALQPTCEDVRGSSQNLAAIPSRPGGVRITKQALYAASEGVSAMSGTTLQCYRFARLNLVQLGHAADAVLFRFDGTRLVPVVRGYINFADPSGRFMIVHGTFAGYDGNGLPLNDYLEAIAM